LAIFFEFSLKKLQKKDFLPLFCFFLPASSLPLLCLFFVIERLFPFYRYILP